MLIAFHKPYGILSQFTPDGSPNGTLAAFGFPPGVHPIGRLDADSEGLLLLSDEAELNARLLRPEAGHRRRYWAQVERVPTSEALAALEAGVMLQGRMTLPATARLLQGVNLPPREPPIRFRKNVPDSWLELELVEGKNRQVRRMTAAVGHPTLRLVRVQIGEYRLGDLAPGAWREVDAAGRALIFAGGSAAATPRQKNRPRRSPANTPRRPRVSRPYGSTPPKERNRCADDRRKRSR